MTDEPTSHGSASSEAGTGSSSSDPSYWDEPANASKRSEWLAQLQAMIEQIATQAAPVMREVGAKAAELAAVAGEKAGPVAHRAAELTTEAGLKLAERSRALAEDIRRDQATRGEGPAGSNGAGTTQTGEADTSEEPSTTSVG